MEDIGVIFFIGPRACGKSTIAKKISELLHCDYIDCDVYFTEKMSSSIADYVRKFGWDSFREEECRQINELVEKYSRKKSVVIATGGGVVLREENRNLLKRGGLVFYLSVQAEDLIARLKANPLWGQRPSLTDLSLASEVANTLEERKSLYLETANYVIDASRDLATVTSEIAKLIRSKRQSNQCIS